MHLVSLCNINYVSIFKFKWVEQLKVSPFDFHALVLIMYFKKLQIVCKVKFNYQAIIVDHFKSNQLLLCTPINRITMCQQ